MDVKPSAELIAGDLALAIHLGYVSRNEKLPSQPQLMKAYGVSMGTAAAAIKKLADAGLITTRPGSGTYPANLHRAFDNPVVQVMQAASVCRHLAALHHGRKPDGTPNLTVEVGGDPEWGTSHEDEKTWPPRQVDVSALAGLDRHILRWMSEEFLSAARRLAAHGVQEENKHLLASARSIINEGGKRPERQPGIAHLSGDRRWEEDVTLRIWPERAQSSGSWGPNDPPF